VITDATVVFPNNAVTLIANRMKLVDEAMFVFKRPLRVSDPSQSVGVLATLWTPDDESIEMIGVAPHEPTIQRYELSVQAMVNDSSEERGLARHSVLSEIVRSVLYADPPLRVALATLHTEIEGVQKRTTRWGVAQQRYFSNELEGSFIYLSTLGFWLETETF
jgi:hypothetical protein